MLRRRFGVPKALIAADVGSGGAGGVGLLPSPPFADGAPLLSGESLSVELTQTSGSLPDDTPEPTALI